MTELTAWGVWHVNVQCTAPLQHAHCGYGDNPLCQGKDDAICLGRMSEAVGLQTQMPMQLYIMCTSSLYVATISPCREKLAQVT